MNLMRRVLPHPVSPMITTGMPHLVEVKIWQVNRNDLAYPHILRFTGSHYTIYCLHFKSCFISKEIAKQSHIEQSSVILGKLK